MPGRSVEIPPQRIIGLKPWFPWPLSRWPWLTEPVRAERLAALRIGLSLLLLIDILVSYLPFAADYFTSQGIGGPKLFSWMTREGTHRWSLLSQVDDPTVVRTFLTLWAVSALTLLFGIGTRLSALVAWVLAISVANANPYIDNAGDRVRNLLLLYLVLCPCGAAWSVDRWIIRRFSWRGRRAVIDHAPLYVHPWPICLIIVQMACIYFFNGLYKVSGSDWTHGWSLYYVLGDLTLTRLSFMEFPIPYWMTKALTHLVLYWELLFPVMMIIPWRGLADVMSQSRWTWLHKAQVLVRWNRAIILWFGVSFHVGIALLMEIGGFPFYMLCCYLPLVCWENIARKPDDEYQPERVSHDDSLSDYR